MATFHRFTQERVTSEGAVFVCEEPECGRRVVVLRRPPSYTVIDRGDFMARHSWSGGTVQVDLSL